MWKVGGGKGTVSLTAVAALTTAVQRRRAILKQKGAGRRESSMCVPAGQPAGQPADQ